MTRDGPPVSAPTARNKYDPFFERENFASYAPGPTWCTGTSEIASSGPRTLTCGSSLFLNWPSFWIALIVIFASFPSLATRKSKSLLSFRRIVSRMTCDQNLGYPFHFNQSTAQRSFRSDRNAAVLPRPYCHRARIGSFRRDSSRTSDVSFDFVA